MCCFFTSRRRHTRCALVTGVQTCALPIFLSGPAAWSDPNLLVTKLPSRSGRGGNMTIKFATLLLAGTILGIIPDSAHAEAASTPEQASAGTAVLGAADAGQIGRAHV